MPSKYRAKRTEGLFKGEPCRYDSMREAVWAGDLMMLEKSGSIRNLRRQVEYVLAEKEQGWRKCSYRADFVFEECAHGGWLTVIADVKGMITPAYRIKRRWMWDKFRFEIRELR